MLLRPRTLRTSTSSWYAASVHIVRALVRMARRKAKNGSSSAGIGGCGGATATSTVTYDSPPLILDRPAALAKRAYIGDNDFLGRACFPVPGPYRGRP